MENIYFSLSANKSVGTKLLEVIRKQFLCTQLTYQVPPDLWQKLEKLVT